MSKAKSKAVTFTVILSLAAFALIAFAVWYSTELRDSENQALKYKRNAKEAIRKQLRDPKSARFKDMRYRQVTYSSNLWHAVCGHINAKNAFGGYTGYKKFLHVKDKITAVQKSTIMARETDSDGSFKKLWRIYCQDSKPQSFEELNGDKRIPASGQPMSADAFLKDKNKSP